MKKQNTEELKNIATAQLLELTIKEVDIALDEFITIMKENRKYKKCPKCGFCQVLEVNNKEQDE